VIFLSGGSRVCRLYPDRCSFRGSRDEDPAKAGLIGLYGQTWRTSGTAKMNRDAMDDLLEAKAAHIETEGDEDSTALAWDHSRATPTRYLPWRWTCSFTPGSMRKNSNWLNSRKPRALCVGMTMNRDCRP